MCMYMHSGDRHKYFFYTWRVNLGMVELKYSYTRHAILGKCPIYPN